MILQSLRELALREGLVEDPAFESKPVRWVIELDADGGFVQVYDTCTPEFLPAGSKKKARMEAKLMVIPRRQGRSSGVKADFLVDNAKYVLALDADATTGPNPKNIDRHADYVRLLKAAPQSSPELQAVLSFLASEKQRAACAAELQRQGSFASNDLFTFAIDGLFLNNVEALRSHWTQQGQMPVENDAPVQCLVCGEIRSAARLHNSIQIRGASTSGVPLVTFNADAFEKYGWSGNDNAPVCTACMTAYVEALRRMTRARYQNAAGRPFEPLNTPLNGDTTAVYWSDNDDPLTAGLPGLRDNPQKVKSLLDSSHKGTEYKVRDAARFFCLVLTGVQGRAIVRRLHTGTVGEVEQNLRRYFAAIDVDRFDRESPLPQFRLLKSLVLNGELDRLGSELGTELWLHALFSEPLSRSFLAAVVIRNRAERKVTSERAALLHLFFASRTTAGEIALVNSHAEPTQETASPMSLDRDTKDPPYLLGRLLAALENLQTAAQGQNLNRTLVDRTFGAASTRPGVIFPQLIATAQHHMSKAGKKLPGRAINLDKLLGEIVDGLNIDGFSATLNLEQQGRFALGYYHQRQAFFRKIDVAPGASPETTDITTEETAA